MKRFSLLILLVLLPAFQTVHTIYPVADTYHKPPSTFYPSDNFIRLRYDPAGTNYQGLLRFDVPASSGSPASVFLNLYFYDGGSPVEVYAATNGWDETTGSAVPSMGALLSVSPVDAPTGGWLSFDVSSHVSSFGASYSFFVLSTGSNSTYAYSREYSDSSLHPYLTYQVGSAATPTAVPISTTPAPTATSSIPTYTPTPAPTGTPCVYLDSPTITSASRSAGASTDSFNLAWSAVSGADGYELSFSSNSGVSWSVLSTYTATSITAGNFSKVTTYRFRVRAYKFACGITYSPYSNETIDMLPPTPTATPLPPTSTPTPAPPTATPSFPAGDIANMGSPASYISSAVSFASLFSGFWVALASLLVAYLVLMAIKRFLR